MGSKQSFVASEVLTQEPEEKYVRVPEGYTVVDRRPVATGQ